MNEQATTKDNRFRRQDGKSPYTLAFYRSQSEPFTYSCEINPSYPTNMGSRVGHGLWVTEEDFAAALVLSLPPELEPDRIPGHVKSTGRREFYGIWVWLLDEDAERLGWGKQSRKPLKEKGGEPS